jgi:hypothetical protein
MTDPTGCSFLSYRRSCADDFALLVAAHHDVGIPTWRDQDNLEEGPTEERIREVLRDPRTANAVLWLTPDVADSDFIQKIEIPLAVERAQRKDGFFLVPVAARGLRPEDAGSVIDPRFTAEDLTFWNVRNAGDGPIDHRVAAEIAARVLKRRLEKIHASLPDGEPLRLDFYTKEGAPPRPGVALRFDWSARFAGREAKPGAWDDLLLPALRTVAREVAVGAPDRPLEAGGLASLPAMTALGFAFTLPRRVPLAWRQRFPDGSEQRWSAAGPQEPSGFSAQTTGRDYQASDLAVLVSVTDEVEPAFAASLRTLPPFRAIVKVAREGTPPHWLTTPGEAAHVAFVVEQAIREARRTYPGLERTHLFLSGPAGLAMMVGQRSNTLGPLQTYEHVDADTVGVYRSAARLVPQDFLTS